MKIYQTESIKELVTALSKAQGDMGHAGKTVENTYFKSKYADLPAVIDAAKDSLKANGLSVLQITDTDEAGNVILITQLNHSSGEWVRGYYPLRPIKNDPQSLGSSFTYGRRYAYGAIVGVASSGEDDDGNAASGNPEKPESAASAKRRFVRIQKAVSESEDPGSVWHDNLAEINAFKLIPDYGNDIYNELVDIGKARRLELQQREDFKEKK